MGNTTLAKTVAEKGIFYSLFFIATTFPLPYKISNIGIVSLLLFWIVNKVLSKEGFRLSFNNREEKQVFYGFILLFLWGTIALVYTDDVSNGIKNIESKLSLLILPLILYDLKLQWKEMLLLIKSYVYSMGLCTVFLLLKSVGHYLSEGTLLTYHDFTAALDFHAVFYSYYTFLAILIVLALFIRKQLNTLEKRLMGLVLFLSFVGLFISASKNVLVVTSLFLGIGVLVRFVRKKINIKEVLIVVLILLTGIVMISQLPAVKNRVAELVQLNGMENLEKIKRGEKLEEADIRKFNGTSLRITFWYVSIHKLIDDGRVLIGLSPGDRRKVMNDKYFENGINPWYENYNIHNQFIQTLVELGIVGLLLYLLIHIGIICLALKQGNYVLLVFIIGLIIFQMTESIIERNKGIVFFTFSLLLLQRFNLFRNEDRDIRN
jgi:O-antigen ligase